MAQDAPPLPMDLGDLLVSDPAAFSVEAVLPPEK